MFSRLFFSSLAFKKKKRKFKIYGIFIYAFLCKCFGKLNKAKEKTGGRKKEKSKVMLGFEKTHGLNFISTYRNL